MKILSLFGGMEVGYMACLDAGLKIDAYYSCEIDKFCNQQTKHNFKNIIQLGDVTKLNIKDLPKIDLLIGGSPCQGFSFAGKQLAFDDPRSALFFEFVKIKNELEKLNPDLLFLLENVNMKKEYLRIISEYVGIFPVNINSNLVSAQNRNRWYWSNIRTKKVGLFDELYTDIPQPEDQGILLKDILESEVDEKYYLNEKYLKWWDKNKEFQLEKKYSQINGEKSLCQTARQYASWNGQYICVAMRGRESNCLTPKRTEYGKQIRKDYESGKIKEQRKNIQQLEQRDDSKTNALTSVQKDNLIITKNYLQWDVSGKGYKSQQDRAHFIDGKSNSIPSTNAENKMNIVDNYRIRRLTVLECARLQTIPEDYEFIVSNSQAYKMLGNGWTLKIISWIFSFIDK